MFGANPKQNVRQIDRYSYISVLITPHYSALQLDVQNACVQQCNNMKFGRHRRFGRTRCRFLSGRRVTFLYKDGGIEFVPRLVHVCETTRRHIPEHSTLKNHHRAHLRSQSRCYPLSAIYFKGIYTIFHCLAPLQFPRDVIYLWNQVFVMVVCNNKHKYNYFGHCQFSWILSNI